MALLRIRFDMEWVANAGFSHSPQALAWGKFRSALRESSQTNDF
jgi:hypothetical protein